MKRALHDASALNSDLQMVSHVSNMVLQQTDTSRVERKRLEEQVSEDDKKLQAEAKIQADRASLARQVNELSLALEHQRRETARQQSISTAVSRKVNMLEDNMRVMSKAWKAAAQHQASIVKAISAQEASEVAKDAKVAKAHKTPKAPKTVKAPKA